MTRTDPRSRGVTGHPVQRDLHYDNCWRVCHITKFLKGVDILPYYYHGRDIISTPN